MILWYLLAPLLRSLLMKLEDFLINGLMKLMKSIALKAIYVMPALLLEKPSSKSKARNHLIALESQLKLCNEGNINELLDESKEIQKKLPSTNNPMNLQKMSMKFKHLMQKGNVNGALKLLIWVIEFYCVNRWNFAFITS